MSFAALGLSDPLLKAIAEQGYSTPTAIQVEAIPAVLTGRDVMAAAQTGTGKTASFTLPILQKLSAKTESTPEPVRVLVLTPTRELAAQVVQSVETYSRYLPIRSTAVYGGVRIESQIAELADGVDVLVATPGRLLDLYKQGALNFNHLEVLVLDEADRMLDMGFIDDIRRIQSLLPENRQTLLFSATFSETLRSFAQGMLSNPVLIEAASANSTVSAIEQIVHPVDQARKSELLIDLIKKNQWQQVLVFTRTKKGADSLVAELKKVRISAESIHADRSQHARTHALDNFKNGQVVVLVATDIAARGLNISQLPCVVNFDIPYVAEDYVHRIGRTGRAGCSGLAISLVSEEEHKQLKSIEVFIGQTLQRKILRGFMPTEKAPKIEFDDAQYGCFDPNAKPKKPHRNRNRSRRRR
ncbi:MAG: DEAD/DEAH box helicase [Thiotrichales bacterium]|nr:DEAD/DEAH box helicase [Thiotrichales bacterium]